MNATRAIAVLLLCLFLLPLAACGPGEEAVSVACVGDSLTNGHGAAEGESYPAVLSTLTGPLRFDAVNCGLDGATALTDSGDDYVGSGAWERSRSRDYDVYLILFGANEVFRPDWRDRFPNDFRALLTSYCERPGAPLVAVVLPPHLFYSPEADAQLEQCAALEREIAEELGLPVIDLRSRTDDMEPLSVDGVHYGAEGYALFAEYIYDQLCAIMTDENSAQS